MQRYIRIILDILLLAVLPVTVCYMLTGRFLHEWLGAGMCVGVIAHHALNHRWFGSLFRGKYTLSKSFKVLVNVLLLADVLALAVSGVFLSKYVFGWTGLRAMRLVVLHQLHFCAGYWGLLLMGVHLGQHVPQFLGMMRLNRLPHVVRTGFLVFFALVSCYGVYAFIQEGMADYLVLSEIFTTTDSDPGPFLLKLISVLLAAAMLGYLLQRLALKHR